MVLIVTFPTDEETTELMEPGDRAFDDPANLAESLFIRLAMHFPASRNVRLDSQPSQDVAQGLVIEALVGIQRRRLPFGPARLAFDFGQVHHQRQQRVDVMRVGRLYLYHQRDAVGLGQQAMLTPRAAAIRRVRADFSPPSGALIKLVSTITRDQSSRSAPRNLASIN